MQWVGVFNRNVSEAYNGVDGYFSVQSLQTGGVLQPYELVSVTPTRVTLISNDFLGSITFIGAGLSVLGSNTPGSPLSFPKLNSGTITGIETRFNGQVSDALNRLAVAQTQQQRDAATFDVRRFANEQTLLRPENDNARIILPNVSADALGDAVLASMQARSEIPLQNFLSQFQHIYTATQPGADLVGFDGNDLLVGGTGSNMLVGQGGNDTLDGGTGGINQMFGGDGSDLYIMTAGQEIISDGILDNDRDIASYIRALQGMLIDLEPVDGNRSTGWAANDTLGGVEGVIGSNFNDRIDGRGFVQGPSSSDFIDGAGGDDQINGGTGSDTLKGGAGFDTIDGGDNADAVGNPGAPDIALWDAGPNDVHFFFNGPDVIVATPFEDVDIVRGVEAFSFAGQVFGPNQLIPSQANLQIDQQQTGQLFGGNGVDLLYGRSGNDWLVGNGADDLLVGNEGNDTLLGGDGSDLLNGSSGNDRLFGDEALAVHYGLDLANQVFRIFQATLDREPDVGGHLRWTGELFTGQSSLQDVADGFVRSPEFRQRFSEDLSDGDFVTLLFNNVLGRDPDAQGFARWTADLADGASRAEVVLGFSQSPEFARDTRPAANAFALESAPATWSDDVFRLFQATLDRAPDIAGQTRWTGELASGVSTLEEVADGFVRSPQFRQTFSDDLSDGDFVTLLFNNVLNRDPDAQGFARWTGELAGGASRAEVVLGFSQSPQFRAETAAGLKQWMRDQGTDDRLVGGPGNDLLAGGQYADVFVFASGEAGRTVVTDLESWDFIDLSGFGYATAAQARGQMSQQGSDLLFAVQGSAALFRNTSLADITDDMILM